MDGESRFLFVYGTLRRSSDHPIAKLLRERARHLGSATVPGRLYDLGPYPALVAVSEESARVRGDLYELRDQAILEVLDRYEGCADEVESVGFERVLAIVDGDDGVAHSAWVYCYRGKVSAEQLIPSGEFIPAE